MEVFGLVYEFVLSIYVFIVLSIKSFWSLFFNNSYSAFFTGMTLISVTSFLVIMPVFNRSFIFLFTRHIGIWIYALILNLMWLYVSGDANLTMEMETPQLKDNAGGSLMVYLASIFGMFFVRAQINLVSIGVSNGIKNKKI